MGVTHGKVVLSLEGACSANGWAGRLQVWRLGAGSAAARLIRGHQVLLAGGARLCVHRRRLGLGIVACVLVERGGPAPAPLGGVDGLLARHGFMAWYVLKRFAL